MLSSSARLCRIRQGARYAPGPHSLARPMFQCDESGSPAVEFALLAPVALLLLGLMVVAGQAFEVANLTQQTAQSAASMISQRQGGTMSRGDLSCILTAASAAMAPWDAANVKIVASEVVTGDAGAAYDAWYETTRVNSVVWSYASAGQTARAPGSSVNVVNPNSSWSFLPANSYLILVEATYSYLPPGFIGGLTGPITISRQEFIKPRFTDKLVLN